MTAISQTMNPTTLKGIHSPKNWDDHRYVCYYFLVGISDLYSDPKYNANVDFNFRPAKQRMAYNELDNEIIYITSRLRVPATIMKSPTAGAFFSFSCKIKYPNPTVTSMLSLSTGTTTLAGPSCKAR